jgi:4-hydroxy-tetrahydrodipicolinate synthase
LIFDLVRETVCDNMDRFLARGTFTALVTPFSTDAQNLDIAAYERLVERQVAGGVLGLVPSGTTGESPALSAEEKRLLITHAASASGGKAWILAGIGANDTAKTVSQATAAAEAGAHALMLVMPSYNRPSQAGLLQHIECVAGATDRPLVLYNIPGRTAVNLEIDTLLRAVDRCPNLVGLKDASGNVLYCQSVKRRLGTRLEILCGDDALTVPMMSVGASGVISVTSNVLPHAVAGVVAAAHAGDFALAASRHLNLLAVHESMFSDSSPGPIKAALASRGFVHDSLRGPLVPASEASRAQVTAALQAYEQAHGAA